MTMLTSVKNESYPTQATSSQSHKEECPQIICSKTFLAKHEAHIWNLKGTRVFSKVVVCAYIPGGLRVESSLQDHCAGEIRNLIPQFGEFGKSIGLGQINTGVPKPIEKIKGRAEDFLNMICAVEGLAKNSFQFMLDQFISNTGESADITIDANLLNKVKE